MDLFYMDADGDLRPIEDQDAKEEYSAALDEDAPLPDRLEAFGKLKYNMEKIATALGYNRFKRKILFTKLTDETTEEYRAYQKGLVMGDVEVDIGMETMAKKGDNFCAAELLKRQENQRIGDLRKQLFGV